MRGLTVIACVLFISACQSSSPAAKLDARPEPTPTVAALDAHAAFRIAFDRLHSSNPPYSAGLIRSGEYTYLDGATAARIIRSATGSRGRLPFDDTAKLWVFVLEVPVRGSNRLQNTVTEFTVAFLTVQPNEFPPSSWTGITAIRGAFAPSASDGFTPIARKDIAALEDQRRCERARTTSAISNCATPEP